MLSPEYALFLCLRWGGWNFLVGLLSLVLPQISAKKGMLLQLKNLKYLPRQSLAYEVYRKQENEVKDLLPQSRRTRKINDKMQQRVVKSLFSQSLLRQINDKMH